MLRKVRFWVLAFSLAAALSVIGATAASASVVWGS
jgi:hypothetical protein